ncbi:MAG: peptidylprolyl isomerase [Candidatus Eisenbacteria bacterium]|nr:peptidylprolyl isomerase [Candidatus Eisenbacteria bacterium]
MISVILSLSLLAATPEDSTLGSRVEGIAAVVGGELILRSDLDGLVEYEIQQRKLASPDDSTLARLRGEMLNQLIDDRLLLNHARQETLTATSDEIEATLQERVEQIRSRFPSESSFMAQLEAEGLDMPRFRELQRRVVEEQLLKAKLQEQLRSEWRIQVSESEVRRFCDERADEIPDTPERVELQHILLKPGPAPAVRAAQDSLLASLKARLAAGESFDALAREYSEDASASLGGDLGYFARGSMVPEFETALERMQPGEVSGVVETRFGLHLIQLVQRDDGGFKARHIIRLLPQTADAEAMDPVINEIYAKSATMSFGELVALYSADADTKNGEGRLGTVAPSTLGTAPLGALLDTLPERTLSAPLTDEAGVHIYRIERRLPAGKPACEEIAAGIRDLLMAEKLEAKLAGLLADLRRETYIEVNE